MLVSCFGIHKSASTFAYRISTEVAKHVFDGEVLTGMDVQKINKDFLEKNHDIISSTKKVLIQKTHSGTNTDLSRYIENGEIHVIASIRDLRDVALSMIDAGADSRAAGLKNQMANVQNISDTIAKIREDVTALKRWSMLPRILYVPYNEIFLNPDSIVGKIAKFAFDRDLSSDECKKINESIPRSTIRLNKGIKDRYKSEMSSAESEQILNTFSEFYDRYDPLLRLGSLS